MSPKTKLVLGIITVVLIVGLGVLIYLIRTDVLFSSAAMRSPGPNPTPTSTPIPDGCPNLATISGTVVKEVKQSSGIYKEVAVGKGLAVSVSTKDCNQGKSAGAYSKRTITQDGGKITVKVPFGETAVYNVSAQQVVSPYCDWFGSDGATVTKTGSSVTVKVEMWISDNCVHGQTSSPDLPPGPDPF